MNDKKRLLVVILLFAVLLVGAYVLYTTLGADNAPGQLGTTQPPVSATPDDAPDETPDEQTPPEPTKAPDVTFYDAEGNAHKLSDYFGKPIVLNFWASWCSPCKMEMPDFESKYKEIGEEVQFLMVNMTMSGRETYDDAVGYVAEQGFTFPVMYDTTGEVMQTYGVTSFPTTYFLDKDGNFTAYANGAITAELLQQGIDMITE